MRIIRLQAANVKRLKVVQIDPEGNIIQVSGGNGEGKSSVLDSIQMVLEGKSAIPSQPVRQGEYRAKIRADLGEYIVTRSFNANGATTLKVESADGAELSSPQKVLDDLIGKLSLDPLEFSRMAPKQQLEQLKTLAKLDVDIDALDRQNAADYTARTDVNRTVKRLTERSNDLFVKMNPSLPKEPVDVDALLSQLEGVASHNAAIEHERSERERKWSSIEIIRSKVADYRRQIEVLKALAEEEERCAGNDEAQLLALPVLSEPRDTAAIRADIDRARQVNAGIAINAEYATAKASENAAQKAADELTQRMEARTQQKADAIAGASMPIEGLGFGDGMVLYKGLPFDQASSAEQLRVSVAIAMAANPKLRVLRIKDGSLLDDKSLRMIAEMATAEDYQVWIETVDTSGSVGIYMEEGEVARVNAPYIGSEAAAILGAPLSEETMRSRKAINEQRAAAVNL